MNDGIAKANEDPAPEEPVREDNDDDTAIADEPSEPSLEEQLAQAKGDLKTSREKMLRVAADFDNFRKRSSREVEDARRRGSQAAVRELLPVFDNLERATAHIGEGSAKDIAEGVQLVVKLFHDTLGKLSIERVPALGQPFDPNVHEAMQHAFSAEHPAGTVMAELLAGYRMGSDLIRPALVVVSKGEEPASDDANPREVVG